MFRDLKTKIKRDSIEKQKSKIIYYYCPTFVFDQKLFITLVSQINFLRKLYSHVCYEKASQHRKFQTFSIKTLTTIACPNFKI